MQVVNAAGVAAMKTFGGRVSMNALVIVAALALEFPRLIVRTEMPPGLIVPALKDFVTVGGTGAWTTRPAVAGCALVPPVVARVAAGIVLV